MQVNVDFTKPTSAVASTTYEKLITAGVITIVVCFLFLASWQSALNILFSIPTSIFGTFIILYYAGFTLNLFTLLALTLSISIVVDDAIMLLENIVRHHRMGKDAKTAAYDGAREILPAASAATLAVIAIFIPIVFMQGVIGKFFFQFGVTMSAAVLLSLLEAVTITPMRAAALMSRQHKTGAWEKKAEEGFAAIGRLYARVLAFFLRFSFITVVAAIAVFVVSLKLIGQLNREFVPMQDQDIIILSGQTPPGSSLAVTDERVKAVEAVLRTHPEVVSFFASIGAGGPAADVNQFFMPVYLKPRTERSLNHVAIMDQLRERFKEVKGIKVSMRDISARNLTSGRLQPVSFNLVGPNLEVLKTKAAEIIDRMNTEKLTEDMDTDFKSGNKEVVISPRRMAMAENGVNIDAVARTINTAIAGLRISKITVDGRRYDIRIKFDEKLVQSIDDLKKLYVRNNFGNLVQLEQLADIEEQQTFQSIFRLNRQRVVGVFGNMATGKSQAVVLERARQIALEVLPEGYAFSLEGAAAGMSESFNSLVLALLIGLGVAYMVLAVQFNSFVHPLSVLFALPFSVTGALLVLYYAKSSLNLFSMIGLIVLMGISKKNSILLVEFANHVREHSTKTVKEALLEACPVRLRPIIMTSVATVAAALPLVIGNTIGQEVRTPMGLTIIGGTIVSTLFTLIVVPCLYQLLSHLELKKHA